MNNLSTQDNLNQPLVINSDDSIDLSDEIKILKKPYYNLDLLK